MQPKSELLRLAAAAAFSTAAFASAASAAPCVTASLSSYIALGAGGCTVNDKTFSAFTYSTAPVSGLLPTAANVTVIPVTTLNNPGLTFQGNFGIAGASTTGDILMSFDVKAPASHPITDSTVTLIGGVTGAGNILDAEVLTSGAVNVATVNAGINFGTLTNPATVSFAGQTTLHVVDDTGLHGTETLSAITKQFSETAIPEPASLALLGVGLTALGFIRRRKR